MSGFVKVKEYLIKHPGETIAGALKKTGVAGLSGSQRAKLRAEFSLADGRKKQKTVGAATRLEMVRQYMKEHPGIKVSGACKALGIPMLSGKNATLLREEFGLTKKLYKKRQPLTETFILPPPKRSSDVIVFKGSPEDIAQILREM